MYRLLDHFYMIIVTRSPWVLGLGRDNELGEQTQNRGLFGYADILSRVELNDAIQSPLFFFFFGSRHLRASMDIPQRGSLYSKLLEPNQILSPSVY